MPIVEVVPARPDEDFTDPTPAPSQPPVLTHIEQVESGYLPTQPVTPELSPQPITPPASVVPPITIQSVIAHVATVARHTNTLNATEQLATDGSISHPMIGVRYVVLDGDTLHTIAETLFALGVTGLDSVEEVIALLRSVNDLDADTIITPGQSLVLPMRKDRLDAALTLLGATDVNQVNYRVLSVAPTAHV